MAIYETITDEETINRLKKISRDKDWPLDLAAVAAKAGEGADRIIERAINYAISDAQKKRDQENNVKTIERLRTHYSDAMKNGNVQRAMSVKRRLHREFGVLVS